MTALEVTANVVNLISIYLANRNHVQTWWTGIVGCILFGWLFFSAKLYADVTLQGFFIITGLIGWWRWRQGPQRQLPVRHASARYITTLVVPSCALGAGYAYLLQRYTDAAAPWPDVAVATTSVLGQILLMDRRVECWWFWLLTNTIAVPLFASRELWLTAGFYVAFWCNALVSVRRWRRLAV